VLPRASIGVRHITATISHVAATDVVIGSAIGLAGTLAGGWMAITIWINKHADSP
jgi:hypothetical protein